MTKNRKTGSVLRLATLLFFFSAIGCKKEDKQPDNDKDHKYDHVELSGSVLHHDRPISFARVFIKKGTSTFPGKNHDLYDNEMETGSDANFHFHDLVPASYYIYSEGWDSTISDSVFGGIPLTITGKSETQQMNVPVTE